MLIFFVTESRRETKRIEEKNFSFPGKEKKKSTLLLDIEIVSKVLLTIL